MHCPIQKFFMAQILYTPHFVSPQKIRSLLFWRFSYVRDRNIAYTAFRGPSSEPRVRGR